MNKDLFEECFSFFVPFNNLSQVFLREKAKIEERVRKSTNRSREKVYKELLNEINESFDKKCKGKSVPIELVEYCKSCFDFLVGELIESQQEIVTYKSCLVKAELAFSKGDVISMINPNGKLADFGKPADIKKD